MGKCQVPALVSTTRIEMVMEILMWYCSILYQEKVSSLLQVLSRQTCAVSGGLLG